MLSFNELMKVKSRSSQDREVLLLAIGKVGVRVQGLVCGVRSGLWGPKSSTFYE